MFFANDDNVLFEIDVGGELHEPVFVVEFKRNRAQILASGVCGVARETDVLGAEKAFGITCFGFLCPADFFGSFFGFGKVDGDDYFSAIVVFPAYIPVDVGATDVSRFFGKFAQPLSGFHAPAVRRDVVESLDNLGRRGHHHSHEFGFEKDFFRFVADVFADGKIAQSVQNFVKIVVPHGSVGRLCQTECVEERIGGVNGVRFVQTEVADGVVDKTSHPVTGNFFKRFSRGHKTSERIAFLLQTHDRCGIIGNGIYIILEKGINGNTFDRIF